MNLQNLTRMTRSFHWVPLILVLVGCAVTPSESVVPGERAQETPSLVFWSLGGIDFSARFAAYPSGVVIYRKELLGVDVPQYMQAHLSREQYVQLLGPARLNSLAALEARYWVSGAIQAPDNILQWVTKDGRVRQILVAGFLEHGSDRAQTPPAYLSLFDDLVSFDAPDARSYVPEAVEVVLSRVGSPQSEGGVPWPSEWPTPLPEDATSPIRPSERLVAVLPGASFEDVHQWVSERESAVELVLFRGEVYIARMRAVLPGHPKVPEVPSDAGARPMQ
jgi:hypothetical protein